jgi:hypothetical protein
MADFKIIQAVNAMISNAEKISNINLVKWGVDDSKPEYYFVFDMKFKWSIMREADSETDYRLFFYPQEDETIEDLINVHPEEWSSKDNYIVYRSAEIKTKEAKESFSELYKLVQTKRLNVDVLLDEIIKTK